MNIIKLLIGTGCILIGFYFSIGALGSRYYFNPLVPYAIVSLFIMCFVFYQGLKKPHAKGIIPFIVFIIYGAITLSWTAAPEYGYMKIFNLFAVNLFFIGAAWHIVKNFYYFNICLFIALCLGISILYVGIGSPSEVLANLDIKGRIGGEDSVGTISVGRFLGFSNLCVSFLFISTRSNFKRVLLATIFILSSTYMFFSGTRGAIFGFILAVLFLLYYLAGSAKERWKISVNIFGVCLFLLFLYFNLADSIIQDFVTGRIESESGSNRLIIYMSIIRAYLDLNLLHLIIGAGSGSATNVITDVSFVSGLPGSRLYPHNIFLEIIYEYGIIGLVLFLWACIYPLVLSLKKLKHSSTTVFLMSFWVFWAFNSLVSGDILANFLFFGVSIVLMVNYYSKRRVSLPKNTSIY